MNDKKTAKEIVDGMVSEAVEWIGKMNSAVVGKPKL